MKLLAMIYLNYNKLVIAAGENSGIGYATIKQSIAEGAKSLSSCPYLGFCYPSRLESCKYLSLFKWSALSKIDD